MIEHRHLRYFLALADLLHYGKAAARVNVAQSSLSRQIADLESQLGCQLFLRTSRSVELTLAGLELQRSARLVMQAMDSAIRSTQAVARGDKGALRIAFTSMIAWTGLPKFIKNYAASAPQVSLELSELLPAALMKAVQTGECDVALTFRTPLQPPYHYRELLHETLSIALPADHRLARQARVSVADLADEPFILSPRHTACALFDSIDALCRQHGFEPRVRMYTQLQGTIVNLVGEGLGVSIIPTSMSKSNPQSMKVVPIDDAPTVALGMVWSERNANPCLAAFIDAVEDSLVRNPPAA
ncbi:MULTISPECIES: LysR substrate-binding domain-containing protein [unclassified Pseudomonas]|uniref:LysR substrate-binding domain-containing protein n=1 Tax=unclassified Pseudomonas TaxID=196821 RepID=UPI0035BF5B4C